MDNKYHHKSGSQKRKEKATREASEAKGQKTLDSLLKSSGSACVRDFGRAVSQNEEETTNIE